MKLIRNEVRILLDRMRQRPEDFEDGLVKNKKWLNTFNRVKSVATLPEKFMLKHAAKQVIRENALRSVVDAVAGWGDKEEPVEYKHTPYSVSTGNIMSNAALTNIAAGSLSEYFGDRDKQYMVERQQAAQNIGMLGGLK